MSAKVSWDKIGISLESGKEIFEHKQREFKIMKHRRNTPVAIFDGYVVSFYLGFLCIVDLK